MNISVVRELIKKNPWVIVLVMLLVTALPKFIVFLFVIAMIAWLIHLFTKRGNVRQFNSTTPPSSTPLSFLSLSMYTKRIVLGSIVALLVVFILFRSIVVIAAGQTGVVSVFGRVNGQELHSGIQFVNPLARVNRISIRTEEFSMTKTREGGEGDPITVLTKEGLDVTLDVTILYRLVEDKASDIYSQFGLLYRDVIIRPIIRSVIRQVISEFEAKDIYSEKRQEVVERMRTSLAKEFEPRGLLLEEVLLRDVELPDRLIQSIQDKLTAEQESQRYQFLLEQANKEAERKRIEAAGQRDSQKIITESLTPTYLHYQYIQNLKDRAGTIYVPVSAQNGLPLFQNIGGR